MKFNKYIIALEIFIVLLIILCIYFVTKGNEPDCGKINKIKLDDKGEVKYIDFGEKIENSEIKEIILESDRDELNAKARARFEVLRAKAEGYAKKVPNLQFLRKKDSLNRFVDFPID